MEGDHLWEHEQGGLTLVLRYFSEGGVVRLHGELDTTKKCLTHNGLVAGWRVAALASLFVRMRPLAVLLFSCVTVSSHLESCASSMLYPLAGAPTSCNSAAQLP